jgi:hypothetical protein
MPWFSSRSRSRPTPSKLSASTSAPSNSMALVAPASRARSFNLVAYSNASSLKGAVMFSPHLPSLRNLSTAAGNPPIGASSAMYSSFCPVWLANSVWIIGDFEWPIGLPMTA